MKRLVIAVGVILFGLAAAVPAEARVFVHFGFGCCGYYPYYSPYYYGYPYYSPPVVYAPPPPVVYQEAPQVIYVQPPVPAAAPVPDSFTDAKGRSCRHFQTSVNGSLVNGTACLGPDGTWHTVGE